MLNLFRMHRQRLCVYASRRLSVHIIEHKHVLASIASMVCCGFSSASGNNWHRGSVCCDIDVRAHLMLTEASRMHR